MLPKDGHIQFEVYKHIEEVERKPGDDEDNDHWKVLPWFIYKNDHWQVLSWFMNKNDHWQLLSWFMNKNYHWQVLSWFMNINHDYHCDYMVMRISTWSEQVGGSQPWSALSFFFSLLAAASTPEGKSSQSPEWQSSIAEEPQRWSRAQTYAVLFWQNRFANIDRTELLLMWQKYLQD